MKKIATILATIAMALTANSQVIINGDINAPTTINQNYYGYREPIQCDFALGILTQFSFTDSEDWFAHWKLIADFRFERYDLGIALGRRCGVYQGYQFDNGITLGVYGGMDWSGWNDPKNPIALTYDFGAYLKYEVGRSWEIIGEVTLCGGLGIGFAYTF